jgi:hypothetical protein
MKTDELIQKAAERGLTIDKETAEKYINLSDEELANLNIAGGEEDKCSEKTYAEISNLNEAERCTYFEAKNENLNNKKCNRCKYMVTKSGEFGKAYCTHPDRQTKSA